MEEGRVDGIPGEWMATFAEVKEILGVEKLLGMRAELDADVVYRWQERDPGREGELTRIEIRAVSRQRSTVGEFDLSVRLEVDVDGQRFFERDWHETIPRHLV